MATAPGMFPAILKGLGAPVTANTLRDLQAWQRAEGGSASFNPFNTTQGGFGGSNYNSVGVKNYGSAQTGIAATLRTLNNGRYGAIVQSLRSGGNPGAFASAIGGSPWGTSGSLVAKILNSPYRPQTVSLNTKPSLSAHNTVSTSPSRAALANFLIKNSQSLLNGGTGADPRLLVNALQTQEAPSAGTSTAYTPSNTPAPSTSKGVLNLPATFKSTHDTAGLSGFPALDVFGSAGSNVVAPVGGKLVYVHQIPWSESKRVGGYTGYLQGDNGKTYYLTHFGSMIPAGRVTAGESLGTLGAVPNNWWPSHVHLGVYNGIYNPPGA